ncbi:response regulator transcription factor [Lysinibacillus sp. NPDC056232]|uniref:response regulator transcription factor n=1 Tax=Lysinibacillus sp. NPDC056232 TaxID=3345756 RepID=UPI0035E082D3
MGEQILIVDDNEDIISFLKPALEIEGYIVDYALNGKEALSKMKEKFDVVLLDVGLPDIDGFTVCEKIKQINSCPIIFLTAKGLEQERVKGFLVGGVDYIVKPFSLKELLLRLKVHIKKQVQSDQKHVRKFIKLGEVEIDILAKSIKINDQLIDFTKKEYEIIELLSIHPGQVFSKEQIFELIWEDTSDSDINTITEHIRRIRSKISANTSFDNCYIKTVWGVGYKWGD